MLTFLQTSPKASRYLGIACLVLVIGIAAKLLIDKENAPPATESAGAIGTPAEPVPAATPVQNAGLDDPTPQVPVGGAPVVATARVNPNGEAVFAGHADPADDVTLYDGDAAVGAVAADQLGEWVLLPIEPLKLGTHLLRISAKHGDQAAKPGERDIALAIFAEAATTDDPSPGARVQAVALSVPHAGFGPSDLLQVPDRLQPAEAGKLSVTLIDYTQSGIIALEGHARPGAQVKITLGDRLLGSTDSSAQGLWRLDVESRNPGSVQQLHVEQLDDQGQMSGLVDLTFDQGAGLSDLPAGEGVRVAAVGEGWRIARRVGRGGTQFTLLFPARPISAAKAP